MKKPDWYYDEMRQTGVDFEDESAVISYDAKQGSTSAAEKQLVDQLNIKPKHVVVDMGAGTGSLALETAKCCDKVHAVDVSNVMLAFCRSKAESANISNIRFHHAGFLTYEHQGDLDDVVVSRYALHHLPDFWKSVALKRIRAMLKPGGLFYLEDVIFSFDSNDYEHAIDGWVNETTQSSNSSFTTQEFATHVKEEYSTYFWIIEGMLIRAGFEIEHKKINGREYATFECRKPG